MKKTYIAILVVIVFSLTTIFYLYKPETEPRKLRILCAGSLLYPLERVVTEFEKESSRDFGECTHSCILLIVLFIIFD